METEATEEKHSNLDSLWSGFWVVHIEEAQNIDGFETKLGYKFSKRDHLYEALTHRSAVVDFEAKQRKSFGFVEAEGLRWNERIEFLGDSVLGLVITNYLWERRQEFTEGDLSRLRASLVNEEVLAGVARTVDLGDCVALGRGEQLADGRSRDSLLADALEAVIGAVYLDGGFAEAKIVVESLFKDLLESDWNLLGRDYKTQLQELAQDIYKVAPTYEIIGAVGPDHAKTFDVAVYLSGKKLGVGTGASKKRASQKAAQEALISLAIAQRAEEKVKYD